MSAKVNLRITRSSQIKQKLVFFERAFFYLLPTAHQRVNWLKKKKKLALLGEHVHWQPRKYPADAQFLKIHNNVAIAAGVEFTMHDIIHWVFDGMAGDRDFAVYKGCIEVYDNVFIGADARILPNVKIGPNAIIAAGSVINRDVPEGTVVAGVPARVIGSFEDFRQSRIEYTKRIRSMPESELPDFFWRNFYGQQD